MNILAAVFLYNPDIEKAISNIERYVDGVSKLIVWNNTPNSNIDAYKGVFKDKPYEHKIIYAGGKGNMGMSKPINFAIKMAIDEEYDCLLTMDQDSVWQNFDYYISQIKRMDFLHNAFEPSINRRKSNTEIEKIEFDRIINSGMIYGREALKAVGYMNEDFFVEGIDIEYGYRILINEDVKLFRLNNAILSQNVGEDDEENMEELPLLARWLCKISKKNMLKCKYSAIRLYGLSFSSAVISKEFPGYIGETESRIFSLSRILKYIIIPIMLYGSNKESKINRIKSYIKGWLDGNRAVVTSYDTSKFKYSKKWDFKQSILY